jgi:RNA polymerase sigma-70 factor (ECF subfamily)
VVGEAAEIRPDVVADAVRGDPLAVTELMSAVHQLVLPYARARLVSRMVDGVSAEDLAQEVCVRILRALPHYQERGRPFMAFAYSIAANALADVHRRVVRCPTEPLAEHHDAQDPSADPEEHALHGELRSTLQAVLRTVPTRLREVLVLRVALGLSVERTAELLGVTRGAVRIAQHRALDGLRNAATAHEAVELRLLA